MRKILILVCFITGQVFAQQAGKVAIKGASQDFTKAASKDATKVASKDATKAKELKEVPKILFNALCDIETDYKRDHAPSTRASRAALPNRPPPSNDTDPMLLVNGGAHVPPRRLKSFFKAYWQSTEKYGVKEAEARTYLNEHPHFDVSAVKVSCALSNGDRKSLLMILQRPMKKK
jgi:hypothetical protein